MLLFPEIKNLATINVCDWTIETEENKYCIKNDEPKTNSITQVPVKCNKIQVTHSTIHFHIDDDENVLGKAAKLHYKRTEKGILCSTKQINSGRVLNNIVLNGTLDNINRITEDAESSLSSKSKSSSKSDDCTLDLKNIIEKRKRHIADRLRSKISS